MSLSLLRAAHVALVLVCLVLWADVVRGSVIAARRSPRGRSAIPGIATELYSDEPRDCSTRSVHSAGLEHVVPTYYDRLTRAAARLFPKLAPRGETVPLHLWWFVHPSTTDTQIENYSRLLNEQAAKLRSVFGDGGIELRIDTLHVQRHDTFYHMSRESAAEVDMMQQFRRGGMESLNVFVTKSTSGGTPTSWGTFPWEYRPTRDGVILSGNALSRHGSMLTVLIHEVGHWFGLFHTFEGGCDAERGDYVPDTPPAAPRTGVLNCPVQLSTCEGTYDQTENYMDYNQQSCRCMFTEGQFYRMRYYARQRRLGARQGKP